MADEIEFIDNFPAKFNFEEESCLDCDDRPFCQLAKFVDSYTVLFKAATTDFPITNGTFTGSLAGWTVGSGWSYNADKARSTNSFTILSQNIGAVDGNIYKITFDITNFSGDGGMEVLFSTEAFPTLITSNGSYTIYIMPLVGGTLRFRGATGIIFDLDNVVVEELNTNYTLRLRSTTTLAFSALGLPINISHSNSGIVGFTFSWFDFGVTTEGCYTLALNDGNDNYIESTCYNITDEQCNSFLFAYHNNGNDAFDIPYSLYGLSLKFYIRLACDIRNPSYKGDVEKYIDSGENNIIYFGRSRKLKDLVFAEAPEYIHDAIAIMMVHSNIYIDELNKERYVFEDSDYTPEWDSNSHLKLAESRTLIGKYNGK